MFAVSSNREGLLFQRKWRKRERHMFPIKGEIFKGWVDTMEDTMTLELSQTSMTELLAKIVNG